MAKVSATAKPAFPEPIGFAIGDKIMWQGIPLVVCNIAPDGTCEARSQTMHVVVTDWHDFVPMRDAC